MCVLVTIPLTWLLVPTQVKAPYTNVLDKRVLSAAIDAANRLRGVSKGDITLQRICSTVPGTSTCKFVRPAASVGGNRRF
mgnify:FL=1